MLAEAFMLDLFGNSTIVIPAQAGIFYENPRSIKDFNECTDFTPFFYTANG